MDDSAPFPAFAEELTGPVSASRDAIRRACYQDERAAVQALLAQQTSDAAERASSALLARELVVTMRAQRSYASGVDALMHEFPLSSNEGIALMCLAEALLRIPDRETADRLIADKIGKGDWHHHTGHSPSLFVNAAAWGLLLTGKLLDHTGEDHLAHALTALIARGGEPLIRKGMERAMRMLGEQFVAGRTITEALQRGHQREARGYRHSYDMLGEAALTAADVQAYFLSYQTAIHAIGKASQGRGIKNGAGISVKLSALHPRYTSSQRQRVMQELLPRLKTLLLLARQYDIGLNIDAEEADRLELSLDLMERLAFDPDLAGFDGIGFVVQAYQKRCPCVIDYLIDLARRSGHRFMIRLVKGAYWDMEIKRAQRDGLPGYPVYTRKAHTDLCYLVCAQRLLAAADSIYPQFATHNALTMATIVVRARSLGVSDYEFQCLHGMGEALYDQVIAPGQLEVPCRIYAPVGSHETLLAYLVRRLLENGANSSFVNQIVDPAIPEEMLLRDPVALAQESHGAAHPSIPLPVDLYRPERINSRGIDLDHETALRSLSASMRKAGRRQWHAYPLLGEPGSSDSAPLRMHNPADHADVIGTVRETSADEVEQACATATCARQDWGKITNEDRAAILLRAAELYEHHGTELMALAIREAGKTLPNAVGELREAIDFLRYYGAQIGQMADAAPLGSIVCISPWNFPLSIFTGQIAAALAAGNTVLAKPAEQTPLIAFRAVQLLHEAGVPYEALLFLPGRGETVGAQLVADRRTSGAVFTGSTEVARHINGCLARRAVAEQREIALIAETGGQNAMIADSSALCEQLVRDVLTSAFDSAGQRCSALRVLCLQNDIADSTLAMLRGALQELRMGRPDCLATDIGPVINTDAQQKLLAYISSMQEAGYRITQLETAEANSDGYFVAPTIIEIDRIADLKHEVFGPVLHVLRYAREELPQLVDDINATGYGLTLGIHSRIDPTIDFIVSRARVGNIYVNRNMIGAVVGVQPFGGEGLSGTGPKAGGPLYLHRLRSSAASLPAPIFNAERAGILSGEGTATPFSALIAWSDQTDTHFADLCRSYAHVTLHGTRIGLPGPTGESNSLQFTARGNVLCATNSTPTLLNQLAAVFATGNRPVMMQAMQALLPPTLPQEIRARIEWIGSLLESKKLALVLHDAASFGLLPLIAERDGPIVPAVLVDAQQTIPLWRLVTEQAVCINTAAAGGNAALMTIED